jgi:hypothetical protein
MQPSKEWSITTVTWHGPSHCAPNPMVTHTPSKKSFCERFSIIDPFQKHHGMTLADSAHNRDLWLLNNPEC